MQHNFGHLDFGPDRHQEEQQSLTLKLLMSIEWVFVSCIMRLCIISSITTHTFKELINVRVLEFPRNREKALNIDDQMKVDISLLLINTYYNKFM